MGLRFRKSVTLCKGVKLNFGKTGMSVTLGSKGYHKTINTNGNVTTSVGIPGTGIYYTDTKKMGAGRNNSSSNRRNSVNSNQNTYVPLYDRYDEMASMDSLYDTNDEVEFAEIPELKRSVDIKEESAHVSTDNEFCEVIEPDFSYLSDSKIELSEITESTEEEMLEIALTKNDITRIYKFCDPTVEWTEIISGATASELLMDNDIWSYCKKIAPKILAGDIDTYLQAIEDLRPLDDLLMYSGDFEFGTDKPYYLEVEFTAKVDELLPGGNSNPLFEDFITAVSIRVARDLMSLLPVSKVIVHVVNDDVTVMSGIYDLATVKKYNGVNMSIEDYLSKFEHNLKKENGNYLEVERITISDL